MARRPPSPDPATSRKRDAAREARHAQRAAAQAALATDPDRVLSTVEASVLTGKSQVVLYKLVKAGKLRNVGSPGRMGFTRTDLLKLIE
jgi:hypothetical protein